jgi:hypothetical protein
MRNPLYRLKSYFPGRNLAKFCPKKNTDSNGLIVCGRGSNWAAQIILSIALPKWDIYHTDINFRDINS